MTDPRPESATVASSRPSGIARTEGLVGYTVGGRYRIVRPLASGGMGSVFVAEQLNLKRPVAIKVVTGTEPALAERFRREAEALVAVSHPSIVEIYDFLTEPDPAGERCFLVMALVEGQDLADYRAHLPDKRLAAVEVAELAGQAASALVELHAAGIVHRDIKPANFIRFARADGRPGLKLVDFGIARRSVDPGITGAGYMVGTPSYMAPETLMGKAHSPLADVYALGATLYEMLVGAPPHGEGDLHGIITRRVMEPLVLPPDLQGSDLGRLVAEMLDREETCRPDARHVVARLEEIRAMFSLSRRMPVAPAPAVVVALPSTLETEVPRSQRPTLVKPPADPAAAAPVIAPTPPVAAALEPHAAAGRPRLPPGYVAAGIVIVIAAVLGGVLLGRRDRQQPTPPAQPPAEARGAQPDAAALPRVWPDAAAPRVQKDAAAARPGPDAASPELPTVEALVEGCKTSNEAYRLFLEGRAAYGDEAPARQEYALRVFQSLLRGGHAGFGERAWSAKLAASILIRRRACGPARELWRTHQRFHALLAKQKGKRSKPPPFPRCP